MCQNVKNLQSKAAKFTPKNNTISCITPYYMIANLIRMYHLCSVIINYSYLTFWWGSFSILYLQKYSHLRRIENEFYFIFKKFSSDFRVKPAMFVLEDHPNNRYKICQKWCYQLADPPFINVYIMSTYAVLNLPK